MAHAHAIAASITLAIASLVYAALEGPSRAQAAADALAEAEPARAQMVLVTIADARGPEGAAKVRSAIADARHTLYAEAHRECAGRDVVSSGAVVMVTEDGDAAQVHGYLPHRCDAPRVACTDSVCPLAQAG